MKKALSLLLLAVAAGGLALGWTFVRRPLPIPDGPSAPLPPVATASVTLSVLHTADISSQHGFLVRGGDVARSHATSVAAFLVEHPKGAYLIDAGLGRDAVAHFATTPLLMRSLAQLTLHQSLADALAARPAGAPEPQGVLLTHAHWDHVSGLADRPDLPVWVTDADLAHAREDAESGRLFRMIEAEHALDLRPITFPDGAYGPFPRSWDVHGDGAIVLVPLHGHTPGSVGIFVSAGGRRFLFVGDTTWTQEGLDWPAEKPWLARRMVDADPAGVRSQLVLLHRLRRAHPDLAVVPAHDARAYAAIRGTGP